MKTVHQILTEKIETEMQAFKRFYAGKGEAFVYHDAAIICFKEEAFAMLTSNFLNNQGVEKELAWLATLKNPIQELYNFCMDADLVFQQDWNFLLDVIRQAYNDAKEEL